MGGSVCNRLEIDVMQVTEVHESTELAFKYNLPAIVVHQSLSSDAIIARSKINGKFKIITPIDWPKGELFGFNKVRGLTIDSLETDGFELLLTNSESMLEVRNEASMLTEFIKNNLPSQKEVRFVLGTSFRNEADISKICNGLLTVRTPTLIRTDVNTKLQISKANPDEHNKQIKSIRDIIKAPVKISGNIMNLKSIAACQDASRFGVSILQAKAIIKEFQSQPNQLLELLNV